MLFIIVNNTLDGKIELAMNQQNKALNSAVINSMKPSDKDISDTGENRGLRVSCGKAGKIGRASCRERV